MIVELLEQVVLFAKYLFAAQIEHAVADECTAHPVTAEVTATQVFPDL